jgi:hypothetical protein
VIALGRSAIPVLDRLADADMAGGMPLAEWYPALGDDKFVGCATEARTDSDIETFGAALEAALKA